MENWIERQKNILDFTLSSIFRRKRKNIALMFVYTLIVFFLASVMLLADALKQQASILLDDSPEMIVQRTSAGRHDPIPLSYIDPIRTIRGVQSVRGRLWGYYFDQVTGANYTVIVPEGSGPGDNGIEIGQGIARTRFVFGGDTMEFRTFSGKVIEWEIRKVLSAKSEIVSSDLVLVSENSFRLLFGGSKDFATDLALRVRNPRELSTIALKIAERLPDTRLILKDEILRTYEAVFNWRSGLLVFILSGALLAFMILAWDKASGLSMEEKKEIGILKAIGWETSDVILMKFWEGTAISLSSFLSGIILAYVHVFFTSAPLFEPVLKGWSVLYPRFELTPFVDLSQVAVLFFLTVVPYTVATIIPSWRVATVDPDSVMR